MLKSAKAALLVAATLCLFESGSMAATLTCYSSTKVPCASLHKSKGANIKHHPRQRHIARKARDRSTGYYAYSGAPESGHGFGYGSPAGADRAGGQFAYGPPIPIRPYPGGPYPGGPPVVAGPIYNFYGPTNNYFGPIYNRGQVGNVRGEAGPDLSSRLDPWHGYDGNNGLENGY
jgi:hypothetical protein